MDVISIVTSLFIVLSCVYLLLSPFFEKKEKLLATTTEEEAFTKEQVFATMNELEMEYNMKKLTTEEYEELKEEYEELAISLLEEEGMIVSVQSPPIKEGEMIQHEIERQLEQLRQERGFVK